MKHVFGRALQACGMALAIAAGAGSSALAQQELRFTSSVPANSFIYADILDVWAQRVAADSEGTISIRLFPAGTLGRDASGHLDMLRSGAVDIAYFIPGYTPGAMTEATVVELPNTVPSATVGSTVSAWPPVRPADPNHANKVLDYSGTEGAMRVVEIRSTETPRVVGHVRASCDSHCGESPEKAFAGLRSSPATVRQIASGRAGRASRRHGAFSYARPHPEQPENYAFGSTERKGKYSASYLILPPTTLPLRAVTISRLKLRGEISSRRPRCALPPAPAKSA